MRRLQSLFRRRNPDRELDEELRFHLEERTRENIAAGMSPEDARRAARLLLGNPALIKEDTRAVWTLAVLERFWQDLAYAVRSLAKSPGFTLAAVLTLALGIGANSAIFSVVNAVLLRPLPYPGSDRIAIVFLHSQRINRGALGSADFLALEQRQQSFDGVAAVSTFNNGLTLTGQGDPVAIPGSKVTGGFFSTLRVRPELGRTFLPGEDRPGHPLTVVVSHEFWEQFLHSDPAALGRSIALDGKDYTVIGVMPASFHFGPHDNDEMWPVLQLEDIHRRPPFWLFVIGRLKSGVGLRRADADVSRIAVQISEQYPLSGKTTGVVVPLKEVMVGDARMALLMLMGAVGLVLLIAIINVASLQLARASGRRHEMAIRAAIGAGRGRLISQSLTESILLGLLGGGLGLVLASAGLNALLALNRDAIPRANEIGLDARVLLFTAIIAVGAGIVFGLVPAFDAAAARPIESLQDSDRRTTPGSGSRLHQDLLVVGEFSLALVLLAGAGLLIRSLSRLESVNPGFHPEHILTAQLSLPQARYRTAEQLTSFYERLVERLEHTPGVDSAGISLSLPPNLLQLTNPFRREGEPIVPGRSLPLAEEIPVSADYFRALSVPLLRGRLFNEADRAPGTHVLLINQTMVRQYFPGSDPVGKRVQTGDQNPDSPWYTIVGVVGDVKYQGLGQQNMATMYVPYFDDGWSPWFVHSMYLVVRAHGDPTGVARAVRSGVWSLDDLLPVNKMRTMDQLLTLSTAAPRFRVLLFAQLAGLALILAIIGIYGVIAYGVGRRTHEIGVRMALGAGRREIFRLILGRGLALVMVGVAIGTAAALGLTRLLKSLLFDVSATDPGVFAAVAVVLVVVALCACYFPARRATRIDPLAALRHE
ncbi:MAG: ABC transporter permease [Acidobacteriota bacterium]|nr:ABC transporter permease [Acidobacteriota bacterium]